VLGIRDTRAGDVGSSATFSLRAAPLLNRSRRSDRHSSSTFSSNWSRRSTGSFSSKSWVTLRISSRSLVAEACSPSDGEMFEASISAACNDSTTFAKRFFVFSTTYSKRGSVKSFRLSSISPPHAARTAAFCAGRDWIWAFNKACETFLNSDSDSSVAAALSCTSAGR
jgi:hypothetical protein